MAGFHAADMIARRPNQEWRGKNLVRAASAARSDPGLRAWLAAPGIARTEDLPAALQSRWVDASTLPSKRLPTEDLRVAALAETKEFRRFVGREPAVAVPPTFVWNDDVETAWAAAGIRFVVTPGRRYESRNADGAPSGGGPTLVNGARGRGGIMYLVRDTYFEPARGHKAERALDALASKSRLGRPTLLETHRANFIGDPAAADAAVSELERLLEIALKSFPDIAFLSTEDLASRIRRNDPWLLEHGFAARLHVWLRRLWQVARLRKLAWLTGVIIPGGVLYALTRPAASRSLAV